VKDCYRNRELDAWRVSLPNVMGCSDMKFRFGRGTARQTVILQYADGRLSDMPQDLFDLADDAATPPPAAPTPAAPDPLAWIHD
jgi:hypothetical protein